MTALRFLPPPAEAAPEIDRMPGRPHPREMLSLIGQAAAERAFLDLAAGGRLHHALLLTGPEGIGKATLAYRIARFLLGGAGGQGGTATLDMPEGARVTQLVAGNAHPDLAVLRRRHDPKTRRFRTEIGVEETREALALFSKTAAHGGWRIVIVDCADDLNAASANALLKTLEEPPERALFLIVAHQPRRLLPTIRSRCRVIPLAPLGVADLARIVAGLTGAAPDPARLAGARGSVRRALRLADPAIAARIEAIHHAFAALPERRQAEIGRVAEALRAGAEGEEPFLDLADETETWLAELLARAVAAGDRPGAAAIGDFWAAFGENRDRVEAFNLDRRAFAITLFEDAAALVSGLAR
ncbi:DNA polymerase III subunit delta' [Rhabdaerophilum calidifontis]|uniref:DNA polymerase III subunit delta' n=1 Tax=Rhabdaerophilum calidifontis TaxID=2604328 RepID=UPI00123BEF3C|nr:DNA polymerase III subunit delta' [Rhabdaerophilum calidifontis]